MVHICSKCGSEKKIQGLLYYNKKRRTYRINANLYSMVAPITARDAVDLLEPVARRFQIVSNTYRRHVTLAEGLALPCETSAAAASQKSSVPSFDPRAAYCDSFSRSKSSTYPGTSNVNQIYHSPTETLILEPIRKAMSLNHYARVNKINLVPTHRGRHQTQQHQSRERNRNNPHDTTTADEYLVLLEVTFCGIELQRAVQALHNHPEFCCLPQYPLHVTLGVVPVPDVNAFKEDLSKELVGVTLALNWSKLTLLNPPTRQTLTR